MALTRVNGNLITSGTITGTQFGAASITGDKIGLTAITSNLIVSAAVTGDKIGLTAITSNLIASAAVTGDKIAPTITLPNVGTSGATSFLSTVLESANVTTVMGSATTINIASPLVVFTANSSANSTVNFTGLAGRNWRHPYRLAGNLPWLQWFNRTSPPIN